MLFNSLSFLFFFPIVCIVFFCIPVTQLKLRNLFLLFSSYYFYMCWEPTYALLLFISTIVTYLAALGIGHYQEKKKKKLCLVSSIVINLSILFLFKYYNFFANNLQFVFQNSGLFLKLPDFKLLLPVGISFYTFQALGYSIDVYRGTIRVENNFFTYALFVSFFPQLVAGPIERAKNLLPQFHVPHKFNSEDFIEGLKLMIWGYFMKLCIADSVSFYVDAVYNNLPNHNGTSILMATFYFTFQIFCDFSGYSLIAIGVARCLGFRLMQNFNRPYLSSSPREFWHRWHISLSSWFADYVYIPLGGSRCSEAKHQCNLFLTMLISGLWHGANWTFIVWGGVHGLFLCLNSLANKFFKFGKYTLLTIPKIFGTFLIVMFLWIFFRANCFSDAILAIQKIFTHQGMLYNGAGKPSIILSILLIFLLLAKEIKDEFIKNPPMFMHSKNKIISILSTVFMIVIIMLCGQFNGGQFIYFQF